MKLKILNIFLLLIITFILGACAQIGTLSGGPKDTTPPKLVEAIPQMKSVNFSTDVILLKFDENIQLKNLNNELMVSPKLKTKPDISVSGKKLTIKLIKEELLPNTTYRIYFGKAIADMHESNPILNFNYIFSTGSVIDTLKLSGKVVNAFSHANEEDVVVGLYYNINLQDSFPFNQTPDYISRTNNKGVFEFENLPSSSYKLLCFTDQNKDYKYSGSNREQIGYLSDDIQLSNDSSFTLQLFQETHDKTFIKKVIMTDYGEGTIVFNQKTVAKIQTFSVLESANFYYPNHIIASDSCKFYYKNQVDSLWLKINFGNSGDKRTDTLKLRIPKKITSKIGPLIFSSNITGASLAYFDTLKIHSNNWLDSTRTVRSKLKLLYLKDSTIIEEKINPTWVNEQSIQVLSSFKPKTTYTLQIDSGFVFDFEGKTNNLSNTTFNIKGKSEFGKLNLSVTFNKKQAYIIQLMDELNKVVAEQYASFSLSASNTAVVSFINIVEGNYKVKIIYDSREDKVWNTGSFLKNVQPEKTYIFEKSIKIIPNWEINEEFILKE